MGVKIAIESDTWGNDDARWCAVREGRSVNRSITLNLALFNALHAPNGFIPSGIVLAKVTATGLYGPFSPLLANGLETPLFHLFAPVDYAASGSVGAAGYWNGVVNQNYLPTFTGAAAAIGVVTSAVRTALGSFIRYEGTNL